MSSPSEANLSSTHHRPASDNPPNNDDSVSDKTREVNNDVEQQKKSQPELVDQTHYLPRRYIIQVSHFCGYPTPYSILILIFKKVFLACASVGMTGLLDETMIAVALPIIASDLNTGDQITAVATAYFMLVDPCFTLSFFASEPNSQP